jgi:hypothetical protein
MARRSGQSGYIERKGNYYWGRFWKDEPGQGTRVHLGVKICPVSGPGSMTKPERKHRLREIIQESGADTAEHLQKTAVATLGTTFGQQAEWWIENVQVRNHKPVKERTAKTWESHLKWINRRLGDTPLADVKNLALKNLVAEMVAEPKREKTKTASRVP